MDEVTPVRKVDIIRTALGWVLRDESERFIHMPDEEVEAFFEEYRALLAAPALDALVEAFPEDSVVPGWVQPWYEEISGIVDDQNRGRAELEDHVLQGFETPPTPES